MVIKLNFSDPLELSPMAEQDKLVFHIKEPSFFFRSVPLDKNLHKSSWTMRKRIRKQMPDTDFNRGFEKSSELLKTTVQVGVVTTFILGFLLGNTFDQLKWYFRSLQMILHIPMMNTMVPSNVSLFFQIIIPIITFDVFDPEWTTEKVLDFEYEK